MDFTTITAQKTFQFYNRPIDGLGLRYFVLSSNIFYSTKPVSFARMPCSLTRLTYNLQTSLFSPLADNCVNLKSRTLLIKVVIDFSRHFFAR